MLVAQETVVCLVQHLYSGVNVERNDPKMTRFEFIF